MDDDEIAEATCYDDDAAEAEDEGLKPDGWK